MSFCALVGGLITLIGTSPNIIVARVRAEMTGQPFGMFDYAPVGLALTAAALLFLVLGWRLLPRARVGTRSAEETFAVETYASEMRLPAESSYVGRTIGELEAAAGGEATVIGIIRERFRRYGATHGEPLVECEHFQFGQRIQRLSRCVPQRPVFQN